MSQSKLIIVDDDSLTCELLATASEHMFAQVDTYSEARQFLHTTPEATDIVLLDLQMPDIDGVETIRRLAGNDCQASFVLISGYDESVLSSARVLAKDLGLNVQGCLTKPIGIAKLSTLLDEVLSQLGTAEGNQQPVTNDVKFTPSFDALNQAITEHQLVLFYQPQMNLSSHTMVGVEALVRWQHPEHGLIYPDSFIELAERTGLIDRLTEEVINLAVQQSKQWHEQGYAFKISVNISGHNITNLAMPEYLESLVKFNCLDPHMLVMEITESALMSEITTSLDILTRLRLKGFSLSIDDFGTGFSSLSQLHKIPFTELKVDQSFVMKMMDDPQSYAIVETCIMLGQKLKMTVVAEGVENANIWHALQNLGCDIAQGYHIAKPLCAEDLIDWYQEITRMRSLSVAFS